MAETLFEELKRYVGWGEPDERALRDLHAAASGTFQHVVDVFYETIRLHEGAYRSLSGGEEQIERLKETLKQWLDRLFRGPWDEDYFENRSRIGKAHVRIGLPQQYMFAAMNVVRGEFGSFLNDIYRERRAEREVAGRALDRILDLDLAIMLHTFREELLAQQARVERLSTFGQLAGSIGHDLRNPLAAIETSVYLLRNLIGADERSKRHLDRIGEQVALANGIIANLLGIIRDRPLAKERVKLESVVGRAAEAVVRPQEVRLAVGALSGLEVEGDPGQLQQVFVNLFVNAVEAVSPRGDVMVNGILAGREVLVSVDDTGPGVSQAIARRLFEPLTSTKDKGVGLGLALVKRIVERHGGTVTYQRRAGGGARFLVHLPAWGAGG